MSRTAAQILGGVLVTLACLVPGVQAVVLGLPGTTIPAPWWLACYATFAGGLVVSMWLQEVLPLRTVRAAFAVQAVSALLLVVTAPGFGWAAILLVFNAALSAYLVPARVSALLVVANTAAIAAAGLPSSSVLDIVLGAGMYLVLQCASYAGVVAMLREEEARSQLSEANVRLRAASALLAESSRAEERLRIARELHDLVGHQLTVLALELEIASHQHGGETAESVARARELTKGLLADVRATVGEMRGDGRGLRETLHGIAADVPRPRVHLSVDESVVTDEERAAALVRCVQEVVTNAIRHSRAENLWIEVAAEDGAVVLEARDDGVGVRAVEPGNGLRGMAERVEALGGTVRFRGEGGFGVRARVPA
ncbi:sensor histidine kinase [Myceligenerans salitolerans]|uniref:Sensor histidine kinase n=1 Tax=Myceligenerans salitolerans TaxID=1230528 RepID=A0ABS3I8B0_9MICO|nr:sensor histidine kinase [Myceligenerans salitolerans]MBO0609246.1 sensor histidine kinase [Myceligenerans salitolerans]